MSRSDHDLPKPLLERKNEEIAHMSTQLLAHMTNASHLQTRLLQALDALDECQRNRTTELKDAERKYARLEQKLQGVMGAYGVSEAEKDDLRESVLEMVEKVEQSNAICSWPCNRLQITRFIGHPQRSSTKTRRPSDEDKLAYAGAIIERLRRERDDERVVHILACEASQAKIEALEAQLARREAELEYCATRMVDDAPSLLSGRNDGNIGSNSECGRTKPSTGTGSSTKRGTGLEEQRDGQDQHPEPATRSAPAMTNEQILKNLDMTAARNRALEVEIKTLFKRLEQARSRPSLPLAASASKTSPQSSGAPSGNTTASGVTTNSRNGDGRDSGDRASDEDQQRRFRNTPRNRGYRTPALAPSSLGQPSRDNGRESRRRTRKPEASMGSQSPRKPESVPGSRHTDDFDLGASGSKKTRSTNVPPQAGVIAGHTISMSAIAGLYSEIQALAAQIDAFSQERELGMKVVATQREGSISRAAHQSEHVGQRAKTKQVLDGDCQDNDAGSTKKVAFDTLGHRLGSVEKDCLRLRHEFEKYKLFTQAREDQLLDRVQTLQKQVEELNSRWPRQASTPFSSHQPSHSDDGHQQLHSFPVADPTPGLALEVIEEDHFQATAPENCGLTTEVHLPQPPFPPHPLPQDALFDAIDEEISMELATPLQPTSILVHPDHTESQLDDSVSDVCLDSRSIDWQHGEQSNTMGSTPPEELYPAGRIDGPMGEAMIDPPTIPLPPSPSLEPSDAFDDDNDGDDDGGGDGGNEEQEERDDDSGATVLLMAARGGGNGTSMTPPPGELVSLSSAGEEVSVELASAERELAIAQEVLEQGESALREVEAALVSSDDFIS